ncbi:hypothetical protein MLD38_002211 [Melastoma candidum]|uniref:Uncharacterized protein n=1 Tax=Melastoma candidum TaxID=119954 RepID=A0ACB9SFQ1_9MYRT|nr:hypothetical protein MLD38_002211 [Melastoma candidum]
MISPNPTPTIPSLPIYLKFEDVRYKVKLALRGKNAVKAVVSKMALQLGEDEDRSKHILKEISRSVGPGEILSPMGPPGSGKMMLLKVIGGRITDNLLG